MDNKKLLMGTAMVALSTLAAQDAHAVTEPIDAEAVVLESIVLTEVSSLNFGNLTVAAGTAGSITVDSAGTRTDAGGVTLVVGGSADHEAKLKIEGAPGLIVTVDATAGVGSKLNAGGATDLTLSAFDVNGNVNADTALTIPVGGSTTISIGGTLQVPAGAPAGTYTGTFNVDVTYN